MYPSPLSKPSVHTRRQFIGAGLAAAVLATTSSCSSGNGSSTSAGGSVDFTYWGTSYEKKSVAASLQKYQKAHPKQSPIHVDFIPNSDYDTKMTARLASNQLPDIGYMGSNLSFQMAEQGRIVNMLDYTKGHPELDDFMPDIKFFWAPGKAFFSWALETMLLYYSTDAFNEAKVPTPPASADTAWGWDEFVEMAQRVTIDQNGRNATQPQFDPKNVRQYGLYIADITSFQKWYPLLLSNHGEFVNANGTSCKINSPQAVTVFQNLHDLIYKYHVTPTPASLGKTPPTSQFELQNRQAAMSIDGFWQLLDFNNNKGQGYGVGVLPKYQTPVTIATNSAMIIKDGDHVDEAIDILLYLSKPDNVPLYKSGLWMPGLHKYYTDPDLIAKWAIPSLPAEQFKTAIVDYTAKHAQRDYHKWLKNPTKIDQTLSSILDKLAHNKESATTVLSEAEAKIAPLLEGAYPIAQN